MHNNNCLNCATASDGNFCPQCGQKMDTHRFTFGAILHDVPHSIFHVDKGLLYTFVQLLYRPGHTIREFIAGQRVSHFRPFAYLFLLCAISSFIAHQVALQLHLQPGVNANMLFPALANFFAHYPALMLCTLIPVISFWSWLFNLDSGYNYWENFVLNTFIMAQFNIFFMIRSFITLAQGYPSRSVTLFILAFMGYLTFAYLQFFRQGRPIVPRLIRNTAMFVIIAFTLITCLSVTGFMTPWWNVH